MMRLRRLPLRYFVPIVLGGFAALISGLAYINTRPAVYANVERQATARMRSTLTVTQGALELLWRDQNLDDVRRFVTSFGAERGELTTALVGPNGVVLASTSLREVGKSAGNSYPALDPAELEHIGKTGGTSVSLSPDGTGIVGYARVCGPDSTSLRARHCGFLFLERSLRHETAAAVGLLRTQTIESVLAIVGVTLLFLGLLHLLFTHRVQRLVASARAFANGDTSVRTGLRGADEFGEIGQALDGMLDTVVKDQDALRLRNKAMADSSNGIVIVDATDPEQPIIDCNPAFAAITGYSPEETVGRNCRFLQKDDRNQAGIEEIRRAVSERRACAVTLKNYRKNGEMFWNELTISPVTADDARVSHFIGIQTDVTERKRAEDLLQESHRELEQRVRKRTSALTKARDKLEAAKTAAESADAAKSRFLAAASHDLRQPLQSLGLYLSVLTRLIDKPAQAEVSGKMRKSLDTMGDLLDALLDVSKLTTGSIKPEKRDVWIAELLDRIVTDNIQQAEEKGLRLQCTAADCVVHTDPALLERVVENFVTNAIRYTEHGGVTIDCQCGDGVARVAVSDTGPGIPKDQLDNIFEEYYQLDNPVRDRSRGLGLGLSIVKHIARLLDHPLAVTSVLGEGSTFTATLPLGKPVERGRVVATPARASVRGDSGPVVLLVDDDLAIVDATTMLLEAAGARVHSAMNGEAALAKLEAGMRPDVVLSDFRLPGFNGIELIRRIRNTTRDDLPTILMTGDTVAEEINAARLPNCTVLQKPVDTERLISLIGKVAV